MTQQNQSATKSVSVNANGYVIGENGSVIVFHTFGELLAWITISPAEKPVAPKAPELPDPLEGLTVVRMKGRFLGEGDAAPEFNNGNGGVCSNATEVHKDDHLRIRLRFLLGLVSDPVLHVGSDFVAGGYVALCATIRGTKVPVCILESGKDSHARYFYHPTADGSPPAEARWMRSRVLTERPGCYIKRLVHRDEVDNKTVTLLHRVAAAATTTPNVLAATLEEVVT